MLKTIILPNIFFISQFISSSFPASFYLIVSSNKHFGRSEWKWRLWIYIVFCFFVWACEWECKIVSLCFLLENYGTYSYLSNIFMRNWTSYIYALIGKVSVSIDIIFTKVIYGLKWLNNCNQIQNNFLTDETNKIQTA